MSNNLSSSLGSFDPFAVHPFTSIAASASSSSTSSASATPPNALPSPPPSPRHSSRTLPFSTSSSSSHASTPPIPIASPYYGSTSSYSDHVARALNAPAQSPMVPSTSWPASPSPSSSTMSSSSSNSSNLGLRNGHPATHIFTDFRAEVERYRREGDAFDLPVLKKKKGTSYPGF